MSILLYLLNQSNCTFRDGETTPSFIDSNCTSCVCNKGNIECYKNCPSVSCLGKTKMNDCGCEICDEESVCRSDADDEIYNSGDSWTNGDNCVCDCKVSFELSY